MENKTINSLEFVECLKKVGEIHFAKKDEESALNENNAHGEKSLVFQLFYKYINKSVKQ